MDKKAAYDKWIKDYLEKNNNCVAGLCSSATEEMNKAFPELKRVAGSVDLINCHREHWWLVDEDGEIIDPTVSQFRQLFSSLPIKYKPWTPSQPVKVGRCMNCGENIMRQVESLNQKVYVPNFCCPDCEQKYVSVLL